MIVGVLFSALITLCHSSVCPAQDSIVQVEEDWELVVADPDVNSNGPQLACAIAPGSDLDGLYATFELNHCSTPQSSTGGLHLHAWDGETRLQSTSAPETQQLATSGEGITWTQRMTLQNGQLLFEVVNGHSTTWSTFGGQGNLKVSVPCSATSLDGYTPTVSVNNSGVSYASHCVQKLILRQVRLVKADGTILSATLNQAVYERAITE
jgi:hypothetical protein